jgi:hypothetical protein
MLAKWRVSQCYVLSDVSKILTVLKIGSTITSYKMWNYVIIEDLEIGITFFYELLKSLSTSYRTSRLLRYLKSLIFSAMLGLVVIRKSLPDNVFFIVMYFASHDRIFGPNRVGIIKILRRQHNLHYSLCIITIIKSHNEMGETYSTHDEGKCL